MGPRTMFIDNSPAVLQAIDAVTREEVDKLGLDIERRTKENIVIMGAVDTGELLESVGRDSEGNVVVTADHAAAVHDGHETASGGFVPGRPFLRKAAIEAAAALPGVDGAGPIAEPGLEEGGD